MNGIGPNLKWLYRYYMHSDYVQNLCSTHSRKLWEYAAYLCCLYELLYVIVYNFRFQQDNRGLYYELRTWLWYFGCWNGIKLSITHTFQQDQQSYPWSVVQGAPRILYAWNFARSYWPVIPLSTWNTCESHHVPRNIVEDCHMSNLHQLSLHWHTCTANNC